MRNLFLPMVVFLFSFGWVLQAEAQLQPPQRVGSPLPTAQIPGAAVDPVTGQPTQVLSATTAVTSPTSALTVPLTPIPAAPSILGSTNQVLFIFNLEDYLLRQSENKAWQYDVINLVSALQGLVNREKPQLYILYVHERLSSFQMNVDEFWLKILRGPNGFLSDYQLVYVNTLEELLQIFRTYYAAVVLWDPRVPASGNVALTIAGADGLLPVRYDTSPDSLFTQIVDQGPQLPPQIQMSGKFTGVGSIPDTSDSQPTTNTPKTDAYMWAKINYMKSGLCSPTYLANYLDPYDWDQKAVGFQYPDLQQCSIVNHDFYVSQKAFFLDLDPWLNETATDSTTNTFHKGIDSSVFQDILKSAYANTPGSERILRIGGFVPWWIKYSNRYVYNGGRSGLYSPEETAEEFVGQVSRYNGILDADSTPLASIANASIFQHFPLPDRYFQNPVPPPSTLENRNYILFVIGDFRSSAMLYQTIPTLWNDNLRGGLPLAWAINPILSERVPHIFDYMYKTRTAHDFFVSGAAGAGLTYLNRYLAANRPEEVGDGLYFWERISRMLYQKFDLHASLVADLAREMRATQFSLPMQEAFKQFSPHGVSTLKPFEKSLVDNVIPFVREGGVFPDKIPNTENVLQKIITLSRQDQSNFLLLRFNLASPTYIYLLYQRLIEEHSEFKYLAVDPYSFFYLLRQDLSGNDPSANSIIPTYISNSIPLEMKIGEYYPSDVTLRNDGWDAWNKPNTPANQRYRLTYRWYYEGEQEPGTGWHDAYIKDTIYPGEQTTLNLNIKAPDRAGLFRLLLIFGEENVRESFIQEELRVVIQPN